MLDLISGLGGQLIGICGYTADGKALELRGKGSGGLAEMAQVSKNGILLLVFFV